jgi:hypothetical protein
LIERERKREKKRERERARERGRDLIERERESIYNGMQLNAVNRMRKWKEITGLTERKKDFLGKIER